jgi:hypothetical protein
MEEALLFVEAAFFDFRKMLLPSRSANNNRDVHIETAMNIPHHLVGLAEVDGDVGLFQLVKAFLPFLGIIDGDDDVMLSGEGGFLHLVAHLSVSYNCYFHIRFLEQNLQNRQNFI